MRFVAARVLLTGIALHCLGPCFGSCSGFGQAGEQAGWPPSQGTGRASDSAGIVELVQALRDLTDPFSVVFVAAAPADEDTGLLTYYRRKLGARTAIIFATSQPAVRQDSRRSVQADAAVGSAAQALRSARIEGSDVYFLNLKPIAESTKSAEVIAAWGHDEALARMVGALRMLQPDVVVTNCDQGDSTGLTAAVGGLLTEAFKASPDEMKLNDAGLPWGPRRLFLASDERHAQVKVNLSEYDRIRGYPYIDLAEAAREPYSFGASPESLPEFCFYKLVQAIEGDSFKPGGTLLSGIELPGDVKESVAPPKVFESAPHGPTELPGGGSRSLEQALGNPSALVDALIDRLTVKHSEPKSPGGQGDTLREKRFVETLERSVALVLGISLTVELDDQVLARGGRVRASVTVRNGSDQAFAIEMQPPQALPIKAGLVYYRSSITEVAPYSEVTRQFDYQTPIDAPLTIPREPNVSGPEYYPAGSAPAGWDDTRAASKQLVVLATIGLGSTTATIKASAQFDIAPDVEMSVTPCVALVKDSATSRPVNFTVKLTSHVPELTSAELWVVQSGLANDNYTPTRVDFPRRDVEVDVPLRLAAPIIEGPAAADILIELRRAGPARPKPLASLKIPVIAAGLEVAHDVDVGFICAPDSHIPEALDQLGVAHHRISIDDLKNEDQSTYLNGFQAIIVGDFAYDDVGGLLRYSSRLLDYVREGGNLIVFGQHPSAFDENSAGPAPFPLGVFDWQAASGVEISISKDSPVLSSPNRIAPDDLKDLIGTAAQFIQSPPPNAASSLVSVRAGAGDAEKTLVVRAAVGRGTYTYTCFQWNYVLGAMEPGPYRLLANLISQPRAAKSAAAPR
jgi:hypothetical protein